MQGDSIAGRSARAQVNTGLNNCRHTSLAFKEEKKSSAIFVFSLPPPSPLTFDDTKGMRKQLRIRIQIKIAHVFSCQKCAYHLNLGNNNSD